MYVAIRPSVYLVPHEVIGERVWMRSRGERLVVVDEAQDPREVARISSPRRVARPSTMSPTRRGQRPLVG